MKYPRPGEEAFTQIENEPEPWEQQPGEPLESYRLFQIYLTLPQPRLFASVTETVGLPPRSRLVAQAASRWNWEKRAGACDKQAPALTGLLRDWRNQLLNELAYVARFNGLQDTGRALDNAAIDKMDRAELRVHLAAIDRLQRGLLRLIPPIKEAPQSEIDEKKLYRAVMDRAAEIEWEWVQPLLEEIYRESQPDTANEPDGRRDQEPDAALDTPPSGLHDDPAPDTGGEIFPWEQQAAEPAQHFYAFRIYLSLMFLQSTRQVAKMAGVGSQTTLAKVARKWTWQERAAAFETHHAGQPLARFHLQNQLLLDIAFESQRRGLSQSTAALEKAQIGRLDRAASRKHFPLLARRQGTLLQQLSGTVAASDRKILDQRNDVRLAAEVEKRALQEATDNWYKPDEALIKIYGNEETAGDKNE